MSGNSRFRLAGKALALAISAAPCAVYAQAPGYTFRLPREPLAVSLNAVAETAHVTIAFLPDSVRGRSAEPLQGRYSVAVALQRLLAGTNLTFYKRPDGTFTVEPEGDPATKDDPAIPVPHAGQHREGQAEAQTLATIQVIGFTRSLQKSLEISRNADSIVDAVTAEGASKFPNSNVAEAMMLIPGITLDRGFGQGSQISINGTPTALNLTYLDGHPVAQTDWLLNVQPNRGFDYTLLSPLVIDTLEVYKTQQARLPSGSIGGTVFVRTREPLDEKANTFSATLGATYNTQQIGAPKPNASIFYSTKNQDGTIGFNIGVSHYGEEISRWGVAGASYIPVSALMSNAAIAKQVESGEISAKDQMRVNVNIPWFQQERRRDTLLFHLQVRPNDKWNIDLSGLYIKADRNNYNSSLFPLNTATIQNITSLASDGSGLITSEHVCGIGEMNPEGQPCAGTKTEFQALVRTSAVASKNLDLKVDYSADNWGAKLQTGLGKSHNDQSTHNLTAFYGGGYTYNFGTGTVFDDSAAAQNPENWGEDSGDFGQSTILPVKSKLDWGSVNFHVNFNNSFVYQILFGIRYLRNHHSESEHSFTGGTRPGTFADVGGISITDIMDSYEFPNYSNDMRHQVHPSRGAVLNWILDSPDMYSPQFETPSGFLNNTYSFTQTTKGAFVQANFGEGGLRGNIGVRLAKDKISSTAYILGSDTPHFPVESGWLQTRVRDFTNVLPSLNITYDDGNGLVYRFAAAKALSWAPYRDYLGQKFLQDTLLSGIGGNPNLDPYKAYVFSGSIAWYFAPSSVVAITPFYYHLLNFIQTSTVPLREFNSLFYTNRAVYDSEAQLGECDNKGFCSYQMTIPHSVGPGKIKGVSLNYQQPFGSSGFHILANYTMAEGSLKNGDPMAGDPKNAFTISPFYENEHFLARLSYSWNSRVYSGGDINGAPEFVLPYTELDGFASWNFNKHFSTSFAILNILNEPHRRIAVGLGTLDTVPAITFLNGVRYMLTLHYQY